MSCVTTTHYDTHISAECATGGSAQCDGICAHHEMTECTCSCHGSWDLPDTVAGVLAWHDEMNNVVARFRSGQEALDALPAIQAKHGTVYNGVRGARFEAVHADDGAYILAVFR